MPAASTVTYTVTADGRRRPPAARCRNTAAVTLPTGVVDSDPPTTPRPTSPTSKWSPTSPSRRPTTCRRSRPATRSATTSSSSTTVRRRSAAPRSPTSFPATITGASWTCTPSARARPAASRRGTGNVSLTVDLAVGASVAVQRRSARCAPSAVGTLVNTAVITPPVGVTDPDGANNVATDTDTLDPVADVSVAKSNGITSQSPGATSSYTITVANAGPSAAPGVVGRRSTAGRRDHGLVDVLRGCRVVVLGAVGHRCDQHDGRPRRGRHGDVHRHDAGRARRPAR